MKVYLTASERAYILGLARAAVEAHLVASASARARARRTGIEGGGRGVRRLRGPVRWFGGKGRMLSKIVPILESIPHRRYCEPFGGGAHILIAKHPVEVETYNDIDRGLADFFRVLASPETFERFYRRVALLPYSRAIWQEYNDTWAEQTDMVERAARWFVWVSQGFSGRAAGWSSAVTASAGGITQTCAAWLSRIARLPEIHARLQRVQIECADWRVILERYDTPETLFYCDPPYLHETRSDKRYARELTTEDHVELLDRLQSIQGMAAVSGYPSDLYSRLDAAGWRRYSWQTVCHAAGHTRATRILGPGAARRTQPRTECLWLSPRAKAKSQVVLCEEV